MKTRLVPIFICITSLLFLTIGGSAAPGASPLGNAFTYQGRLVRDGAPYTGSCDFLFSLFDAETEGVEIGESVAVTGLAVTGGLFTARLDFGTGAFNGDARWLEVAVQCPGDLAYTVFPRQELTASPYALYASSAPWSGITGKPAGLDDGDNDTTYTSGYGLTLVGNSFSINSDEFQVRVIDNCPAGSSIRSMSQYGDVSCETDDNSTYQTGSGLILTDTAFSIDPAYTQRRVNNSCAVGSSIRAINADGSVECHVDLPGKPQFRVSTVDSEEQTGLYNSITIGSDGLGLIATSWGTIKLGHCNDIACSSATFNPIGNGYYVSLAVAGDGFGLVSFKSAGDDLSVLHCADLLCTSSTTNIIDSMNSVGWYSSIAIGSDGFGLISYLDNTDKNLMLADCNDLACTPALATITIVDTGVSSAYISIAVDWDGLPWISYYDGINADLKVARCHDPACLSPTITILDSGGAVGYETSIAMGVDNFGVISYRDLTNEDLKVVHCDDSDCTTFSVSTIDSSGEVGFNSSITIGMDGLGLISYYDKTNGTLKAAHCYDITCSSAKISTLDTPNNYFGNSSITIGMDGWGLISYLDNTNDDLKVAHCGNLFCSPYLRPR